MKIKDIFNGVKESIKIFIIAALINFVGYTYINTFLVPDEKIAITKLSELDNKVSANYDEEAKAYKDIKYVQKLQTQAVNIQYDLQKTKMIRIFLTALMLLTMSGVLAWWLQYIYTDMKFKDATKANYVVLATALFCSTLTLGLVYYVTMSN